MTDPFNRSTEVSYGAPVAVVPGVRRVTCPNASAMTFTGTQSYLVGEGDVMVIDPGPAGHPEHQAALMEALRPGERVVAILVTHSHVDHSPGVAWLAAETGAEVMGFGPHGAGMSPAMTRLAEAGVDLGGGEGADRAFAPDRYLADGERIGQGRWAPTALHTPGHLSNHLSFALEDRGVVFTGDAIMGWATTLVSPPEGDMAAQMATLGRLAVRRDRLYLPGHGHPVEDPAGMVRHQIAHREARQAQILEALSHGPSTPDALARRIYHDVDPVLLPAAARNVFATLLGLEAAGRVAVDGDLSAGATYRAL